MEILKKVYSIRIFRFMTVGVSGVLVNEGTLILLHRLLEVPVSIAGLIAIELAILNNFYWNSRWTWQDRESSGVLTSLLQYHIIALTAGSINYTILMALVSISWLPELANLAGMAGGVSINFLGNHFWTFKSLSTEQNEQLVREQRYSLIWFILSMNALILLHMLGLNTKLFLQINTISKYTGSFLWIMLTMMGDGLLSALLLAPFAGRNSRLIRQYLLATLISSILLQFLKSYFGVLRPPAVLDPAEFSLIGPAHHKRSFPSGHSTSIFITLLIMLPWLKNTSIKILLSAAAILVALSRIVVGVHWPTDIAGAGMLAAGSVLLTWLFLPGGKMKESKTWNLFFGFIWLAGSCYALLVTLSRYPHSRIIQIIIALTALIFILPALYQNSRKAEVQKAEKILNRG